jgi:hypothetical protein
MKVVFSTLVDYEEIQNRNIKIRKLLHSIILGRDQVMKQW